MSRYQKTFTQLKNNQEGAFIPFVMLGDPDFEQSFEIIKCLIDNGADALELGVPFSDPMADGAIIQNAGIRALNSGMTLQKSFTLIEKIRAYNQNIPIGLLMYANLVYHFGINEFYQKSAQIGVDSVLIVDVPIHAYSPFYDAATTHNIAPVLICPPNADDALIQQIAKMSRGYIYMVSRSGITGVLQKNRHENLSHFIEKFTALTDTPLIQGFGISEESQVKDAMNIGMDGVISGSIIVKIIEDNLNNQIKCRENLASFVKKMKASTITN